MCVLKANQTAPEVLLLSKHRKDLGTISIEPPATRLLDRETFHDAARRAVMSATGYTVTSFSPSSNIIYSEHWGSAPSPARLVLAEIDLAAPANRSATLVHELGEKITVVRLPLGVPRPLRIYDVIDQVAWNSLCDLP